MSRRKQSNPKQFKREFANADFTQAFLSLSKQMTVVYSSFNADKVETNVPFKQI